MTNIEEYKSRLTRDSADIFANGSLKILNSMNIDTLVFGTEKDNINELIELAKIQIDNKEYDNIVKNYLSKGLNYPTAMSKALENISNIKIDKPNDLLALSYIKEIIKNNYKITPISIKRTIDYHSSDIVNNITSASNIRTLIQENKDITNYIPTVNNEDLNLCDWTHGFQLVCQKKTYVLYSQTQEEFDKWGRAFCFILGKKTYDNSNNFKKLYVYINI